MRLFERSIRPPLEAEPNDNDALESAPGTVGPDQLVVPGDEHGVVIAASAPATTGLPPTIMPSPWSGWPSSWYPPAWGGRYPAELTDTAWLCVDLNASVLASMPPYLVNAAPSLAADWLNNPDPDLYTSWEEFAKSLFWDYQALGESFVLATARYATGWPARFHVVPAWAVNVELGRDGLRRYTIGNEDVSADVLHVRYQSSVGDAHGHGPLEAGAYRSVAAGVLIRYAAGLASSGGIPTSILKHPVTQSPEQAAQLQADWITARLNSLGAPAVLSGGIEWEPTQLNPEELSLQPMLDAHERRIAALLGVPPQIVGIPTGGDSMTYSSTVMLLDFHWRAGLRPKASMVMPALSEWLLPRGTRVELNRDAYVQPGPYERAQTAAILAGIVDPVTGRPVLTVEEIRQAERFGNSAPLDLSEGVLR